MDHGLDNNSNGSPYHHHHHHQQPPPQQQQQQQQSAQEDGGLLVDGPFYAQDVLVRMMRVAQQQQRQLQEHHNRLQQQALQRQQLHHSQTYDTGATQQREQAEILSLLLRDYCNGDGCEDWAKTGPSTLAFDKLLEHLDKNGNGLEDQDHSWKGEEGEKSKEDGETDQRTAARLVIVRVRTKQQKKEEEGEKESK
ncbi:hypothetical protein BGW42_006325 [Actinomortierella wolfii]|nr:hypothetical protein BGW42_006325 [Actinomortierella wolfii]